MDRVLAPAPANGVAPNVSTGAQSSSASPHRVELLGAPQGGKEQTQSCFGLLLSPQSCFFPVTGLTSSLVPPRHGFLLFLSTQHPAPLFALTQSSALSPAFPAGKAPDPRRPSLERR